MARPGMKLSQNKEKKLLKIVSVQKADEASYA